MPANTYKKLCPICNRKKRFHDAYEAAVQGWTKRLIEGQGERWVCPFCSQKG